MSEKAKDRGEGEAGTGGKIRFASQKDPFECKEEHGWLLKGKVVNRMITPYVI